MSYGFTIRHLSIRRTGVVACAALAGFTAPAHGSAGLEFFEKEVRPLLANNCFECHGPGTQKSGLRLDHIDFIHAGGETGPVITPGEPEASRLVNAVRYQDAKLRMPPTGKLPDEAIATLEEWVARGAPWPDEPKPSEANSTKDAFDLQARAGSHWAWEPIRRPAPPSVSNAEWPAAPTDNFVLAKLEDAGLEPAAQAGRRTLIRRLAFDLTGMPPEPAEIETFVNDARPDAYERLIDRYLASPRFGERWGRHWLDLVRFAETYGHEGDYPIEYAWKYRDYVIRALNQNVPYDQFIIEHIAGDLLENPRRHPETGTNESILGTGFWFMHQATHAPVDVRQDEADRVDNQIDVFSKAFLGMTVSCARCHDHKFDAISTKDYYALSGFLQSSHQQFAFLDSHGKIETAAGRMAGLQDQGRQTLAQALDAFARGNASGLDDYLLAARDVRYGEWTPADGEALLRADIAFEDFERPEGRFATLEGAFRIVPAEAVKEDEKDLAGYQGKHFLTSYNADSPRTGAARSAPFPVERRYLRFRVAGSEATGGVHAALVVDGETVRRAGGSGGARFREVVWDVEAFRGQRAELVATDNDDSAGAWIAIDGIGFTESFYEPPLRRSIDTVAAERGLDREHLERWVLALQRADLSDPSHPLHAWAQLETVDSETAFAEEAGALREQLAQSQANTAEAAAGNVVFETFDNSGYGQWKSTGHAFTKQPAQAGDWRPDGNAAGIPASGVAHSGLIDDRLQGVLRSPSFELTHDNIHIRMAGRNAQIQLVVENYQLVEYNGLLFGQTLVDVNTGGAFVWHNMTRDLSKWKGRRAYIEIIDEGDGYVAVDEIHFSNNKPAGEPPWSHGEAVLGAPQSITDLAARYAEEAAAAARAWSRGNADDAQGAFLDWLLEHQLIDFGGESLKLAELARRKAVIASHTPAPERALAITDGSPVNEHVFIRGNHDTLGDEVPRRFLEAVAGPEQPPIEAGSGRLALARRLLDPGNPLPARVFVNRVWHHLFGRGIVASVDNFGVLGEMPTHPELLDYLAAEFRDNGWDIKALIKRLCMTRAYRMRSDRTSELAHAQDPANKLLHRMRVKRLEGEAIRDSILAVADTLDPAMYGHSVPAYLSPFMGGHRRPATSGPIDGNGRRTIYLEVRRNYLSPMMLAFDMPVPDSTIGRRTVSNVPGQALILMNDPFVAEQAKAWGQSVCAEDGLTPEQRIDAMYREALGRLPSQDERTALQHFLEKQAGEYGLTLGEAYGDPRIWTDLGHVIFTLKEFIFIG